MKKKSVFSAIWLGLLMMAPMAFAQNLGDVVYLKDGSVIHGTIVEQIPDQSIKIQTNDGNIFVYKMKDILKMEIPSSNTPDVSKAPPASDILFPSADVKNRVSKKFYFSFLAGAVFSNPFADFKKEFDDVSGVEKELFDSVVAGHVADDIDIGYIAVHTYDTYPSLSAVTDTESKTGFNLGAEFGYDLTPHFGFGARICRVSGYKLNCSSSATDTEDYSDVYGWYDDYTYTFNYNATLTASLVAPELGLYAHGGRDKFQYRGFVFAGPAWSSLSWNVTSTGEWDHSNDNPTWSGYDDHSWSNDFSGNAKAQNLAAEIGGTAIFKMTPSSNFTLELSYALAKFSSFKNQDTGEQMKNSEGQALTMDFSGLKMNAGFQFYL